MSPYVFRALSYGFHAPLNTSLPAGAVLWFRVKDTPHVRVIGELGMQQSSEPELADQIRATDRRLGVTPRYTVATPAIFPRKTASYPGVIGQYISQRLAQCGIPTLPADDDALNGWARVQAYLRRSPDGDVWLAIDPSCEELIRSMGSALSDEKHPEELAMTSPFVLALRFGLMSRPAPRTAAQLQKIPAGSPAAIMRELRRQASGRQWGQVANG